MNTNPPICGTIPLEVQAVLDDADKHRGAVWLWHGDGDRMYRYQFRWVDEKWKLESKVDVGIHQSTPSS